MDWIRQGFLEEKNWQSQYILWKGDFKWDYRMQAQESLERPFSHWWDWERTDAGCLWSPNLSLVTWRFRQSYWTTVCLRRLKKLGADVGDDGGGSSRFWAGLIFCERDTNWKCLERGILNWGISFIGLIYEHICGGIFLITNSWRGLRVNAGSAIPECWVICRS